MATRFYIGVDVSKATLDWAVTDGKTILLQTQTPNSLAGIKTALKVIKSLPDFILLESVCCMEHTGIYCAHLLTFLYKIYLPIWLESSLQRGRTDAIDAVRIAEYAFRFRDKIRLWQPPRAILQKLASLSGLRQRLLLVRQQLQQPLGEQQRFIDPILQRQLTKSCRVGGPASIIKGH